MPTYTNTHTQFHVAVNGVPFFLFPTSSYPYLRQAVDVQRQQIDSTSEPGEQSLGSWWYRSQSSFHMGMGRPWFDAVRGDEEAQFRFDDSSGVDVWTKGQVSLLPRSEWMYGPMTGGDWGEMTSYAHDGGESGVLFADGTVLRGVTAAEVDFTVAYGASENIRDVCVGGEDYYVLTGQGIYRGALPSGGGGKVFDAPSTDRGRLEWAKGRLYAAVEHKFYELVPGLATDPARALPNDKVTERQGKGSLLYAHPDTSWVWSAIAATSGAVFLSGYSGTSSSVWGHRSLIYSHTVEVDTLDGEAHAVVPTVVGELPHGEYVHGMVAYGDYLIVCTSAGVRVCVTDQTGSLALGPLSVKGRSYGAAVWGQYVWAAGSDDAGYHGLYRLDLGALRTDGTAPYARDIATGATDGDGYVARVAMLGTTGRVACMVKHTTASGVWAAHEDELVPAGWLRTGQLRMDTWEHKLYQYLRTVWDPTSPGQITAGWLSDLGSYTALATQADTTAASYLDTAGSDRAPRLSIAYQFGLARATLTTGPAFRGYQTRAAPTLVKDRLIQLPLLCARRERSRQGRTVERSVWDRVQLMEGLERSGAIVPYQDFSTGESRDVVVESASFVTDVVSQSRQEGADPLGVLLVTLRTVD